MSFLKRKPKKQGPPPIKVCPSCYEPGLKVTSGVGSIMAPPAYYCAKCGYHGVLYLEVDPDEKGEAMADLKKLQQQFPEDVDKDSEIGNFEIDPTQLPKSKKK